MKRRKPFLIVVLTFVMVLSMLAGCTDQPTEEPASETESTGAESVVSESTEPVTFTWATWALAEESLKPTYMSMLDTYTEDKPHITIETLAYPYANYLEQLVISAASQNAPETAHIKAEWLPQFLELDAHQVLNDIMSEELKEDYYDNIIAGATIDGDIVAAPWFNSPYAMFYNKTLLEEAGVTEVPTTWEGVMDAARKISALGTDDSGNKIYGYGLVNSETQVGGGYNVFPHLWVHGGDFLDADGDIVINSQENINAFKEIETLFADEISPNGSTYKDMRNLFAQGVIGFYYDIQMAGGTFVNASPLGENFADEYGTMSVPAMDGPDGQGYVVEHYMLVFNTVDEKAHDAVGGFLDHMSGETVLQILYDAGMGKMTDRESVAEMEIFKNPEDEHTKVFLDALTRCRALPISSIHFMDADVILTDALTKLATSSDSVENIVADLETELKDLYGQ